MKILKFTGQIALFKGGACFNDFSQSIVATGVELFRMLWSYAGHPRRDIKFEIYLIFYNFFLTCMCDRPMGDRWIWIKLIVRTPYTFAYQPCKNALPLIADPYLTVKFG